MTLPPLIAGRYELIDDPIRGSMGEVYKAYDIHLDREVAVKLIHRDLIGGDLEPELVRRFQREARLTARAAHPGVPTIHDVGIDGDRHYVVMELVEGATIRDLISEIQPIPIAWIALIAAQMCAVLARTHEISLIHRDLKPDNIMICPDGTVKLVDFGTAIITDAIWTSRLTPPGVTAGDARYQAPERYLGIATPRSDLYALGRVLQDMLSHHGPDAPAELCQLADELTHEHPQHRPATAAHVLARLTRHIGELPPLRGFVTRHPAESLTAYGELAMRLKAVPAIRRQPAPNMATAGPVSVRQVRAQAERYREAGQYHRAASTLESAIVSAANLDPGLVDLRRDLAAVLFQAGDAEAAMAACSAAITALQGRVVPNHPSILSARLHKARACAATGDLDAARAQYELLIADSEQSAEESSPEAVASRRELALLLAASGEFDRAATVLERLIHAASSTRGPLEPQVAEARAALALVRSVGRH